MQVVNFFVILERRFAEDKYLFISYYVECELKKAFYLKPKIKK